MGESSAKIFYAPVKSPGEIEEIQVKSEEDLKSINNSIKRIIHRKSERKFGEEEIKRKELINLMRKGWKITLEDVRELFKLISSYMYGRAREPQKYLILLSTRKYSFIYHFELEEAISFEENRIRKFIKYLDDPSLLKFICRKETDGTFKIYDKYNSKGWKRLLHLEPEYEAKGHVKIRIKRSEKTDVVVETYPDDLENIKNTIKFNWKEERADIHIDDGEITNVFFYKEKMKPKDVPRRLKYESFDIWEFMEKYKYYSKNGKIKESKNEISIGDNRLSKPEKEAEGKELTFFILGSEANAQELINEIKDGMKNVFNIAFIELNDFSNEYGAIKIGNFEIFGKIKTGAKIKETVETTFNRIISKTSKSPNLAKLICYLGLKVACRFLKSKGFKIKIQRAVAENLKEQLHRLNNNIELREIDKLCIEFKAGAFFENSPKKFAEKLLENFEKKNNKVCIYFIGINEDTKSFSPIQLSRMRNEYRENLKENLEYEDVKVLLIENVPVSDKEGILLIILYKD